MSKRLFFTLLLALGLLAVTATSALAGGWNSIVATPTLHNPDAGIWSATASPHGGYTTTTNRCRTCHAVHMADPSGLGNPADAVSWRLLRNNSRANECNYCHKPNSGLSAKQPYRTRTWTIRGEHTLDSTTVPDSDMGQLNGGLSCGWCHSVHGAKTLDTTDAVNAGLAGKILKEDPAGNGGNAEVNTLKTIPSTTDIPGGFTVTNAWSLRTAFCADCHNRNSNWDTNANDDTQTASTGLRPNSTSHVQGPAAEGSLEVYGSEQKVAGWIGTQNTRPGCRNDAGMNGGCHNADTGGNRVSDTTNSAFPHQTKSGKLMFENYLQDSASSPATQTNNGGRVMPALDQVCISCHTDNGNGVGKTF